MTVIAIATIGTLALSVFVIGLLLAFTPYLMRRNECFAVTVPASVQDDPRLISLKKRYAAIMLVLTVVTTAVSLVAGMLITSGQDMAGSVLVNVALLVPVVMSFVLMLHNRRKVIALKRSEGWEVKHHQVTTSVTEKDLPAAIPLAWNLIYVPIILGTVCVGFALYPHMPDMLPMHADFTGNINRYVPKTLGSAIGFPVAFEAFMAACFIFSHWMILRSKHSEHLGMPTMSAFAYGRFARAQSVFLFITGILMSGGIGFSLLLASAGFISLSQVGLIAIILCIPLVIGTVVLLAVYGQAGSRVFRKMNGNDELLSDDDEHWKLGVFYLNREDTSIFLPKRFGFGWTLNFARPAAWAVVGGFVALSVAFVVLAFYLAG